MNFRDYNKNDNGAFFVYRIVYFYSMKYIFLFCFAFICIFTSQSHAQQVIPFVDFSNYFRTFQNDNFRVLEFQRIQEYKAGDDLVAYIDNRGNLRVFEGGAPKDLSNMNVEYHVSDHILAWNVGPTINVYEEGHLETLTYFGGEYIVKDSMVVYQDLRYNTLNVYSKEKKYTIQTSTGTLEMPVFVGENILAFRDNGNFYKVWWNGTVYDLGVWNGTIDFSGGTDILAFNDPTTRTFAIFENGEFLDVEIFWMPSYQCGRGFIAYEDRNGNLIHYSKGKKTELSNFKSSFFEVKDDLVVWGENTFVKAYQNEKVITVTNFRPKDHLLKNNVYAFRNIQGGVSALVDGKVVELTTQQDAGYEIYGNAVLVSLFAKTYIVYVNGRKFEG